MPVQPFSDSNGVFAELSFSPLEGGDAGATGQRRPGRASLCAFQSPRRRGCRCNGINLWYTVSAVQLSVPSKAGMPVQPLVILHKPVALEILLF